MIGSASGTKNDTAATAVSPTTATPQTDQQKLEANLSKIISDFSGTTKVSYKTIEIDDEGNDPSRTKGAKVLTVEVNVAEFYSKDAFLKDTGKLSAQIFQASYPSYLAPYDVLVQYYGNATDRYGNTTNKPNVIYAIDKTTYGKVNWSNFDSSTLCDFLKQEEQIDGVGTGPACNILVNLQ